ANGIRRSLVVFQFVLSIVMIAGIIVIFSPLDYMQRKDLCYDKDQKIAFTLYTKVAVETPPAFQNDLKTLPEIHSVSRSDNFPGQMVLFDLRFFRAGGNIAT